MQELFRRFLRPRSANPVHGQSTQERLEVDPHQILSDMRGSSESRGSSVSDLDETVKHKEVAVGQPH